MSQQIIVVGGGLAGLSAAHTVYEQGGNVCVIDKSAFFGGNSTKATSGINGALTQTQVQQKVPDSAELFYNDTLKSARDLARPDLIKVLTYSSASAVEWLKERFSLDLSLISRLGGHSEPRTHRGKERFPGMTITYALMEKLEELSKTEPKRVKIHNKARVVKLIKDSNNQVIGVEVEKEGKNFSQYGPVILATGGYAADFTDNSVLKKHRPDIYELPTTNGDHCTGDGLKMVMEIGGSAVDLEKVQVHPTGLVDPKDPQAKVKFLAAEALRGVGGLLINGEGKRFVDELQHRDFVTGEIWKTKGPVRLVLNSAAGKEIEWHIKHYMGRGLMFKFEGGKALAKEIGCDPSVLEKTFKDYVRGAESKKDEFKKKYFHNYNFNMDDTFYVAHMTPVLHFTMGGVKINDQAQVLKESNPIEGLFAAGEVAGGIHGANRLGGSALLTCVVYGRVAGSSACRYQYSKLASNSDSHAVNRLDNIRGHLSPNGVQASVNVNPENNKVTLELTWPGSSNQQQDHNNVTSDNKVDVDTINVGEEKGRKEEERKSGGDKSISLSEVNQHNKEDDCWVVVNGQVLDVTKFMHDHPGGKKAILLFAGRDASEEFNMLHKPDVVQKYAPETVLGKLIN
ncbi:Flavocytochrome c [Neoconidiobolus thromboides FSU 785]|nr:Flavocytochrome c [Neoconidiobolus thromboides FSU 785]